MCELESISFWQKRIKELEYESARNPVYIERLERAKKRFHNLVMGIPEEPIYESKLTTKFDYSRLI